MLRIILLVSIICFVPIPAWAGIAADTMTTVGLPIIQLLVVAAFGSLVCYITSALGQGQISSMIKLISIFVCISIVIGTVWKAISAIAHTFGLQL